MKNVVINRVLPFFHKKLFVFLGITTILLALNLIRKDFTFYYDASGYWNYKNLFENSGSFSLLNYNEAIRGYLFPFINFLISKIASIVKITDYILYEIIFSIIYAWFLVYIIPDLVSILFKKQIKQYQIIMFNLLAIIFWRDYYFYPLSDLISFMFLILGIYFTILSSRHKTYTLLAGLFVFGTVVIRPSYQIVLIPFVIWLFIYYWKTQKFSIGQIGVRLGLLFLGGIIILSPQIAININHFNSFSPFVQTQKAYGDDLFSLQLKWGIELQKYDTYVGNEFQSASIIYFDHQGENILLDAGLKQKSLIEGGSIRTEQAISVRKYLGLIRRYPLDFMAIYFRHLFNGLDIVYNTPYIKDIYGGTLSLRFLNYLVWFLCLFSTKHLVNNKITNKLNLLIVAIIALPSLASIPTAIEVRFMLSIHFMAYAYLSFFYDINIIKHLIQEKKILLFGIFLFLVFFFLCLTISLNTSMTIILGKYLLGSG